jgi:hypothetical protein
MKGCATQLGAAEPTELFPGDLESIWSLVGGTLSESARAQARHNLEDLYEDVRGTP